MLPTWLDQGVAIVERRERLGGSLGRYGINSDSLGGSYLECLEAPALPEPLRCLRGDPVTHEMAGYRHSYPPLELVDRYMSRLGEAIEIILADRPASTIHRRTTAQALRLRGDGAIAVDIQCPDDTCDTLIARSAVIALGGRQFWQTTELLPGLTLAECHTCRILPSDRILERTGLAEANDISRQRRRTAHPCPRRSAQRLCRGLGAAAPAGRRHAWPRADRDPSAPPAARVLSR